MITIRRTLAEWNLLLDKHKDVLFCRRMNNKEFTTALNYAPAEYNYYTAEELVPYRELIFRTDEDLLFFKLKFG